MQLAGWTLFSGALLGALAPAAAARAVDEVRAGVMAHNICVTDCDNAYKEQGVNLNGELVFGSPKVLDWAGKPHPYLMLSANTADGTSYAGAGLLWRVRLADDWRLEPGLGYVLHDNGDDLDIPYPPGDPRNDSYEAQNLLLGSADLFRTSIALTRELTPRWGVQIAFEHLSHGQILGSGRNQGLDEIGVRFTYRLGEGRN